MKKPKPQKIGWFFFDPNYKTVLLHRRDHRAKESPNMWDCFGGEIKKSEGPKEALIREIEEELDIRVPKNEIVPLIQDETKWVYYIDFPDWLTQPLRLGEGAGYAWFSVKDALKINDITCEAKEILNEFVKKLKDK